MKHETTKTLRVVGILGVILVLFCAFTFLPQIVQANTVTATITVGRDPAGVAVSPNGTYIYVTNENGDSVSVINTITNTVTATIPVGSFPYGVAVSPNGTYIYVANAGGGSVSVISTLTPTPTPTPNPSSTPQPTPTTTATPNPTPTPTQTITPTPTSQPIKSLLFCHQSAQVEMDLCILFRALKVKPLINLTHQTSQAMQKSNQLFLKYSSKLFIAPLL